MNNKYKKLDPILRATRTIPKNNGGARVAGGRITLHYKYNSEELDRRCIKLQERYNKHAP